MKEGKTQVCLTTGWLLSVHLMQPQKKDRFDPSMYQVSHMISAEIAHSLIISVQQTWTTVATEENFSNKQWPIYI